MWSCSISIFDKANKTDSIKVKHNNFLKLGLCSFMLINFNW